jgi:psp operon transcriptional activator
LPDTDQFKALGESEAFVALQERVSRAARTERPVILIGERGTGKELAAARLHLLSQRWGQPYVTINCASLTESLIESELFGHEAGAFTGAVRLRKGRFEIATGGTLFLDEIATLPVTVQEKILRVVEYGQMERVGSSSTQRVDVRLVAATNVDLRALARTGRFRQDLLDRLSFEVIVLPPLRERRDDIPLLTAHFARQMARDMNLDFVPGFSPRASRMLMEHPWPGNVRELKNVVERMVYRTAGPEIDDIVFDPFEGRIALPQAPATPAAADGAARSPAGDLPGTSAFSAGVLQANLAALPLPDAVRALELARIRAALADTRFHQRKAAALLGLTYDQFRGYYRKYRAQIAPEEQEEQVHSQG